MDIHVTIYFLFFVDAVFIILNDIIYYIHQTPKNVKTTVFWNETLCHLVTRLHGLTSQLTIIITVTSVRTSSNVRFEALMANKLSSGDQKCNETKLYGGNINREEAFRLSKAWNPSTSVLRRSNTHISRKSQKDTENSMLKTKQNN
jgi:hypothetical protein